VFDTTWVLIVVLSMIILFIIIGILLSVANVIWVLYRIIKGWLALDSGRSIYAKNTSRH